MNRKIGKFKLWQLLAIGGAVGLIIYEYEKSKGPKAESETPEGFVASTGNPLAGGGGSGSGEGLNGNQSPVAVPGEPGPPGPAGTPGLPSEVPFTLSPQEAAEVDTMIHESNHGLTNAALKPAPPSTRFPQTNSKGEKYRTEKKNGQTVHVYEHGRKVVVSAKKKPTKHPNPNHKPSHAAPRAVVHHGKPKKPKAATRPKAPVAHAAPAAPGTTPRKPAKRKRGHR